MAQFLPAAAIFDLDGTLTDSMGVWEALPDQLVRQFGAEPAPGLFAALREMSSPQAADYLIRTYRLSAAPEELISAVEALADREYRERVPLKPGARTLVEHLARLGVPCAIATASQPHQAQQAMERLGLWPRFRFVLSATQYGPKSRPDIYLEAARRLGAPPEQTLVLEDTLHAARTAARAGFQVAGVYDSHSAQDQEALKGVCRWYLPRLDELDFLAELG